MCHKAEVGLENVIYDLQGLARIHGSQPLCLHASIFLNFFCFEDEKEKGNKNEMKLNN